MRQETIQKGDYERYYQQGLFQLCAKACRGLVWYFV